MFKYLNYLLSTKVSFVLILAFSIGMGIATFMENDHGTAVARAEIYEAWWFELIMVWLAINFIAHIGHYKLLSGKRWPIGLFHIAFILIVLGAGITRYFGREGLIHIREGETGQSFYTAVNYLQLQNVNGGEAFHKPLDLNALNFKEKAFDVEINGELLKVVFEEHVKGAREEFVSGKDTLIEIAIAIGTGREDYLIKKGDELNLETLSLSTTKTNPGDIHIYKEDTVWMIKSQKALHIVEMATQKMGVLKAGMASPLQLKALYQLDSSAFLVKGIYEGKQLQYVSEKDETLAKNLGEVIKIKVLDKEGVELLNTYTPVVNQSPKRHVFRTGGERYTLAYGPKKEFLPFAVKLNKFELERYPGSQSPASYASEVSVIDHEETFPFRIYMNNVLDYKGYRFFQASYDTDEKGTVLSVSQDRPGTFITYLGYVLLTLGMFFTLFAKGSRFFILNKKLKTLSKTKPAEPGGENKNPAPPPHQRIKIPGNVEVATTLSLLLLTFQSFGHSPVPDISGVLVPQEKAELYGHLIVQDLDGRMKPLNTLANEIARKLSGKSTIKVFHASGTTELTAEQFLLAIQLNPVAFSELPLIKVDQEKAAEIFKALNHKPMGSLSFKELLDEDGGYLLQSLVEEANRLKPGERNESHKELLKVDERFNILYALFSGDFLKIFPNKIDKNNTWYTAQQYNKGFSEEDIVFVKNITNMYLAGLIKGIASGEWENADEALSYINMYQQKAGSAVYPSESLIKAELFYNKANLANRLFGVFWLLGLSMLGLAIIRLFKTNKRVVYCWNVGIALCWFGLLVFTVHLGLRWYVAQHAPWSDGFEMLIFVAWGVLLFGLLFGRRAHFTVPLGVLFSGTLLFVAFLDWLNPEITNLMPVLHSYWLKIHVAVIVSGYAPLALAAIMALLTLVLILFKPKTPTKKWWQSMQEITIVNEMAITIGLFLLTVGTFLGGVWANESWGRYWAWDPKETWALISIMIYAFVLHLRLIPKFKNALVFNLVSMWAFFSIIMTSFGVNYYLSGLHSYAKGDSVPLPLWVYYLIIGLAVISFLVIIKYRNLPRNERKELMAV